jgi:hypothetical protein
MVLTVRITRNVNQHSGQNAVLLSVKARDADSFSLGSEQFIFISGTVNKNRTISKT